jgi:hypothetical protein
MSGLKIVFTGHEINPNEEKEKDVERKFNIVKIGDYVVTPESCVQALRDGIFDKYRRQAPRFEVLSFKVGRTTVDDKHEKTVCSFVFEEFGDDDGDPVTISGKATYTRFLSK